MNACRMTVDGNNEISYNWFLRFKGMKKDRVSNHHRGNQA